MHWRTLLLLLLHGMFEMAQMKEYILWLEERGYIEWNDLNETYVDAKNYNKGEVLQLYLNERDKCCE